MPPKKQPQPSVKTVQAAKKKEIEDKTFGMKNKKSAKVTKYIAQLEHQANSNKDSRKLEEAQIEKKKQEEMEKKREKELQEIFKPAVAKQQLAAGVDPKTVLCNAFKAGCCKNGKDCPFSHNWDVERKGAKISFYVDQRKLDTPSVDVPVQKSTGETEIVCKFFLTAIKQKKYGFFWLCPNGESCIYQHALPEGYVLEVEEKQKGQTISVEEYVENERLKLLAEGPMVTEETFVIWKEKRRKERKAKGLQTGREAFQAPENQDNFKDDEDIDNDLDLFDISLFANDLDDPKDQTPGNEDPEGYSIENNISQLDISNDKQ